MIQKVILLGLLILLPGMIFAQGYQVSIVGNDVFLNGEPANKFNKKGEKHGTWIDYDVIGPTIITYKTQKIQVMQSCSFGDSAYCTREVAKEPEVLVGIDTLDDIKYRLRALGQYIKGKKHGTWLQYFPGGKIRKEVLYEKGKITQTFKVYFETGKLKFEGDFTEEKEGYEVKEYSKNGELLNTSDVDSDFLEKSR